MFDELRPQAADARAARLRTFRRAMRRHEKRARRMGLRDVAYCIAWHRSAAGYSDLKARAACLRAAGETRVDARSAFLYERAADAVAKLRGAS